MTPEREKYISSISQEEQEIRTSIKTIKDCIRQQKYVACCSSEELLEISRKQRRLHAGKSYTNLKAIPLEAYFLAEKESALHVIHSQAIKNINNYKRTLRVWQQELYEIAGGK